MDRYALVSNSKGLRYTAEFDQAWRFFEQFIRTTSAVRSTILGSILIFASCVVNRSYVSSNFHEFIPNINKHITCVFCYVYNIIFFFGGGGGSSRLLFSNAELRVTYKITDIILYSYSSRY